MQVRDNGAFQMEQTEQNNTSQGETAESTPIARSIFSAGITD